VSAAPDDPEVSPALAALTALGRDAVEPHTQAELDEGSRALRRRVATGRERRRALTALTALGAAAACVALAFQVVAVRRRQGPATEPPVAVARIDGGELLEGGYLSKSGRAGVTVIFSEGSTFDLLPGARGRLRSVDAAGARLAVERGTAALRVTPNREHRWVVEAGPFVVTVTGTVFSVSWDPASERFELVLQQGHVVVSGPGGEIALRAGQHLVVNVPKAETVITGEPPASAPGAGTEVPPAAVTVTLGPPAMPGAAVARRAAFGPSTSPRAAKVNGGRRWAAEIARGSWDGILADVDREGVNATLENASSEDLFALADAARYRRRTDLARAALLAHRRRFPRAPRAPDAIFLLGRVEELRAQGTPQAIAWYDEYLAQAPTGAYAAEALGRKMILTDERDGRSAARPLADEYLRRFPGGSYAGSARALQRAP
jgi:TolA-binding protein